MKTLRAKFIFWICLLFTIMGILIFISLSKIIPEKTSSLILKRDIRIAHYLSREISEPLLTNNRLVLKLLLEDRLENLEDTVYIFIQSKDGSIISSTFKDGFPKRLLDINNAPDGVKKFLVGGKRIYDIAIPLLKGELGILHLGISLESSRAEIAEFSKINYYIAWVIAAGLGAGVLVFTFLGIMLSNRFIRLKDFASKVGEGDLSGQIEKCSKDEIGDLAFSLNKMAGNLKEKIETIKKLSYLEERDRIALEFHDGLAQDLADIIKRLELCEKLFALDPVQAKSELRILRENTKDVLNKTRRVIYNLKLPHTEDFNLLDNLKNYVKYYELQNSIKVNMSISTGLIKIDPDKARPIFCIIGEALTNVKKHSNAKNVALEIICNNGDLNINIKDDGKGFDINKERLEDYSCEKWGIIGMRQRAASVNGEIKINSEPAHGTLVSLRVPQGN